MGFEPMYLGLTHCTIFQFHGGEAFHLAPTTAAVGALGRAVDDVLIGVDDPDRHLRAAQVRADRRPHGHARGEEFGTAMGY